MTPDARLCLQLAARAVRGPAIVAAGYLVLRLVFAAVTEDDGLLTPSGTPSLGVVALGLIVLILRLVVVLVLPAVLAWRAVRLALGKETS